MSLKLLIADDHQVFIDGISAMLTQQDNISVVGSANNGLQLVEQASILRPDVILTDIQMPGIDGVEATKRVLSQVPSVRIIALTMICENLYVKKMFEAGAHGYLLKTTDKHELLKVIYKVHAGEKHFDQRLFDEMMTGLIKNNDSVNVLSKREKEILSLIAKGLTDKEIAEKVFLSPLTVITHRKNLLAKLGLKNKVELARFAIENNVM